MVNFTSKLKVIFSIALGAMGGTPTPLGGRSTDSADLSMTYWI